MFKNFVNKQQAKQAQKLTELTSDLSISFEYFITAINNKDNDDIKMWAKRCRRKVHKLHTCLAIIEVLGLYDD